ncbi:MAG: hypothetical protein EP346_05675 [Bacteroidetes bacterium]|nr:MAG: hypothetical protein EP346_05675 [Bacteroidota bacterium]
MKQAVHFFITLSLLFAVGAGYIFTRDGYREMDHASTAAKQSTIHLDHLESVSDFNEPVLFLPSTPHHKHFEIKAEVLETEEDEVHHAKSVFYFAQLAAILSYALILGYLINDFKRFARFLGHFTQRVSPRVSVLYGVFRL